MKLSQEAVDDLLHIIEHFDRERGIPHNYSELERVLLTVEAQVYPAYEPSEARNVDKIFIISPKKPPV